jgi:hypothetical protein
MALCYDCIEKYELVDKFDFLERDKVTWETEMGYTAASTYEYMRCPECVHVEQVKQEAIKVEAAKTGPKMIKTDDVVMAESAVNQQVESNGIPAL